MERQSDSPVDRAENVLIATGVIFRFLQKTQEYADAHLLGRLQLLNYSFPGTCRELQSLLWNLLIEYHKTTSEF